jgi:2-hydroxychromene-2-carboxylate isomerase
VRDVLVDAEAAAFLEARGVYATPALAVDDTIVVGFDRPRIDALLGLG